ncbi:4483_t:CDS:10 [Ambispora gerdemannii]|uniref:Anaphase-promoting complex subunit 5 n=1 Tax=Ambispora gerdemannii TaxID=144530 RepID=A0A9N9F8M7_9GLOM|nr:4483_t:CDS:10 [Ambispora gerdemannii]
MSSSFQLESSRTTNVAKTTYLTPHKITLLGLIKYYFNSKKEEFDEELLFFLTDKISNESRFPEPSLLEFCEELKNEVPLEGKSIKDHWLKECRYSPLGFFVRRCHLEGNKLTFNELGKLWQAFRDYKSVASQQVVPSQSSASENDVLSGLIEKYHTHKQVIIAKSDAEKFSLYLIDQLRKYGGVLPVELEIRIREMHERLPEVSIVYYIDYLNCMQLGEYEGAIRSFYKFSNFCPEDEQNRNWYQHVLLNLVVLHAKFGHKNQALLAISEAIRMARENNDQECLRFALSWLYRLKSIDSVGTARIGASEQQMLESLITNAKESNSFCLQSLGELGKAQRILQQGESPTLVYESLLRSSALNMKAIKGSKNSSKSMYGQEKLLNASVYETYGFSTLSTLYTSQVINNPKGNLEDTVIAYCQLADRHISHGNYDEAIKLLSESKEKFLEIRTSASLWAACMGKVLHQRSTERGEWANIEVNEAQFGAICQDDEVLYSDFKYHCALALSKLNREDEAVDILYGLIDDSSRSHSPNQMLVTIYALKLAEIRMKSDDPTSALPFVLSSLCLSERFNYQSSYLLANIRLAQILLHFNLARRSKSIIEKILPMVLAEHSLYLQSVAQFAYAQSLIACLTEDKKANREPSIAYQDMLAPLDRALIGFRKLESISEILHILQLQAYIYNLLDWTDYRNKTAKEYRHLLTTQLETNQRKQPDWEMYYYVRDVAKKYNKTDVDVDDVINAAEKIVIKESSPPPEGIFSDDGADNMDMDIDMSVIEASFLVDEESVDDITLLNRHFSDDRNHASVDNSNSGFIKNEEFDQFF